MPASTRPSAAPFQPRAANAHRGDVRVDLHGGDGADLPVRGRSNEQGRRPGAEARTPELWARHGQEHACLRCLNRVCNGTGDDSCARNLSMSRRRRLVAEPRVSASTMPIRKGFRWMRERRTGRRQRPFRRARLANLPLKSERQTPATPITNGGAAHG